MEDAEDEHGALRSLLTRVKDVVLAPIRIAVSPPFLRTYLRTALVALTSTILFGFAVVAYLSFYYTYIPVRGISVPVYLQFPHSSSPHPDIVDSASSMRVLRYPHGITNVVGLVSRQKYDVEVEMVVPRSEMNLKAGNWMVGLEMWGPGAVGGGVKGVLGFGEEWDIDDYSYGADAGTEKERVDYERPGLANQQKEKPNVLARSRRPAILTYRSWLVENCYRILRLPLYVLNWHHEQETIHLSMMEGVSFDKGARNVPSSLRLELRSKTPLEVYKVVVRVSARLEGLRWVMYRYWFTSFVLFTVLFWSVEITLLVLTWGAFTLLFGGFGQDIKQEHGDKRRIKMEASGEITPKTEQGGSMPGTPLSDTSRTFPTLSSQQPLHYSSGEVKDERGTTPGLDDIPARTEMEADDEDEDADFVLDEPVPAPGMHTDSGIGTSMESSLEGSLVRRRSGGGGKGAKKWVDEFNK